MSSPHERHISGPDSDHQTPATSNLQSNLIPCHLDLISGSSKSAQKRRANTQSCQRSRDRKHEQIKQSFIKELDDCKGKIAQLEQNIRSLEKYRNHYRNERNFYRQCVFLYTTEDKIPPRPCTPPLDNSQEPTV